MDNASKAIVIASGFLIAMLIISLSMYLLDSFQSYYEATSLAIKLRNIQEYNSFFEVYPQDSIVSGDVAFSFYNKCKDINDDIDSDFSTTCSVSTSEGSDVKKIFFFTEYFGHQFKYNYSYDAADGHIKSISFVEQ